MRNKFEVADVVRLVDKLKGFHFINKMLLKQLLIVALMPLMDMQVFAPTLNVAMSKYLITHVETELVQNVDGKNSKNGY